MGESLSRQQSQTSLGESLVSLRRESLRRASLTSQPSSEGGVGLTHQLSLEERRAEHNRQQSMGPVDPRRAFLSRQHSVGESVERRSFDYSREQCVAEIVERVDYTRTRQQRREEGVGPVPENSSGDSSPVRSVDANPQPGSAGNMAETAKRRWQGGSG